MTNGTAVVLMKLYSPAYASATTITAPAGSFAIRGYNTTDTVDLPPLRLQPGGHRREQDPHLHLQHHHQRHRGHRHRRPHLHRPANTIIPAGYRLLLEIGYTPGGRQLHPAGLPGRHRRRRLEPADRHRNRRRSADRPSGPTASQASANEPGTLTVTAQLSAATPRQ